MRPGIPSTLRRAAFLCLVVALLWPSRVAADGSDEQQHSRLEAKVDQLSAQLSRLESLVTAIHAAVTVPGAAPAAASTEQPQPQPAPPAAVPGQVNSPYAKLAAAVGAQWLWDQAHCTESTIHFVFGLWDDSADMPEDFQETIKIWARLNPSNTIKLWSGTEIKKLWSKHFPHLKNLWKKTMPIQRADIGRVMIGLVYGGFYADLDARPSKNLDTMLDDNGFRRVMHHSVVCIEDHKTPEDMAHTAQWPIRKGVPEYHVRISNYFFWASKDSPLLKRVLDLAVQRVNRLKQSDYKVRGRPDLNNPYSIIYSTGPDVLTEATFPVDSNGKRDENPAGVLVVGEDKCHVTNKATGTWIGDNHPAWSREPVPQSHTEL